jgi:hypoxanthine-guanine phosphoribosyltransferase
MKIILFLVLLTGCDGINHRFIPDFMESEEDSLFKVGDCILRQYENGSHGSHVLKISEVLEQGYILQYISKSYNHSEKESVVAFELKKLYRGKELVSKEYKSIDCAAQNVDLETVEL